MGPFELMDLVGVAAASRSRSRSPRSRSASRAGDRARSRRGWRRRAGAAGRLVAATRVCARDSYRARTRPTARAGGAWHPPRHLGEGAVADGCASGPGAGYELREGAPGRAGRRAGPSRRAGRGGRWSCCAPRAASPPAANPARSASTLAAAMPARRADPPPRALSFAGEAASAARRSGFIRVGRRRARPRARPHRLPARERGGVRDRRGRRLGRRRGHRPELGLQPPARAGRLGRGDRPRGRAGRLDGLWDERREERYRAAPLLRRAARSGVGFAD